MLQNKFAGAVPALLFKYVNSFDQAFPGSTLLIHTAENDWYIDIFRTGCCSQRLQRVRGIKKQ